MTDGLPGTVNIHDIEEAVARRAITHVCDMVLAIESYAKTQAQVFELGAFGEAIVGCYTGLIEDIQKIDPAQFRTDRKDSHD